MQKKIRRLSLALYALFAVMSAAQAKGTLSIVPAVPVTGQCGPANDSTFSTRPTSELCASGVPTAVSGTGPWQWSCSGAHGGATNPCMAQSAVEPVIVQSFTVDPETVGQGQTVTLAVTAVASKNMTNARIRFGIARGPNLVTYFVYPNLDFVAGVPVTKTFSWQVPIKQPAGPYLARVSVRNPTGAVIFNEEEAPFTIVAGTLAGMCGASNQANLAATPTTNLCASGTPSSVSGSGPWTWSCAGNDNGTTDSCSAFLVADGVCGAASGSSLTSAPTSNLCTNGSASSVFGTGPWNWSCSGVNGGNVAQCSASLTSVGACGSANGVPASVAPSSGLCASGTVSAVTGTGPWSWSCAGTGPNSTASCAAPYTPSISSYTIQIGDTLQSLLQPLTLPAPTISGANLWFPTLTGTTASDVFDVRNWSAGCQVSGGGGNDVYYEDGCTVTLTGTTGINTQISNGGWGIVTLTPGFKNLIYQGNGPSNNMFLKGNDTGDVIVALQPVTWIQGGAGNDILEGLTGYRDQFIIPNNGGNDTIVAFEAGNATTADYVTLDYGSFPSYAAIISAMTQQGSNVVLTLSNGATLTFGNQQISNFTPNNFTPTSSSFTITNGACGTAGGTIVASAPTAGLCASGTSSAVSGSGPWTWSCVGGTGGSTAQCTALNANASAVCGASNGTSFLSAPTTGLCSIGTASSVTGSGPWNWTCAGLGTGASASCSATVAQPINAVCGPASGGPANSAPTSGLCAVGTASAVSGSGTWSWSCSGFNGGSTSSCSTNGTCSGTTIPADSSIVYPASVPQPATSTDIVGVNIQNVSSGGTGLVYTTFGQVFKSGRVQPSDRLVAHISGTTYQVQLDSLASWPDGSVKLAALTLQIPQVCAQSTIPAMISKATGSDPVFGTTPINFTGSVVPLTVTFNFTSGQYSGTQTINLGTAINTALATNPVYRLQGPLAKQARVDVPLQGGSMHLMADITLYKDDSVTADVQFNNDITTVSSTVANALPPQIYTATVTLNGQSQNFPITQYQYQDWHVVLNASNAWVTFVSPTTPPSFNVQHDLLYLESTGAILPYDATTGEAYSTLQSYASDIAQSGFGLPLASNNVTMYMGQTGGRPDIGYTTQYNTSWLVTGDVIAATIALAQGDTAGAVPWNYKLANGHWLTTYDYPQVWTDPRGTPGFSNAPNNASGWSLDAAHQPNLGYIPYILTASPWYLDRLNAEAAWGVTTTWNPQRCPPNSTNCDIILNGQLQVRGQAWTMREVQEAAFINPPGSFESTYFTQVVADNYTFANSYLEPALVLNQGEMHGFMVDYNWSLDPSAMTIFPTWPTPFGQTNSEDGNFKDWENDYLLGIVGHGALMGFNGAAQYLNWAHNFLTGRFLAPGMNPRDGFNYDYWFPTSAQGLTWAQLEANSVAHGESNGTSGPFGPSVNGDYGQLARAALAIALTVNPGDAQLAQALALMNSFNAPYCDQASFQIDPTFNVVPR